MWRTASVLLTVFGCEPRAADTSVVTTAPDHDTGEGYIAPTGSSTTEPATLEVPMADAATAIVHGSQEYDWFGARAYLGDLTGDGELDLLAMSAHRFEHAMMVFEGPLSGEMDASGAFASVPDGLAGAGIGDLDGDGAPDMAILRGATLEPFTAELYFGPLSVASPPTRPDAVLVPDPSGQSGGSCDANLDGVDDLVFVYPVGDSMLQFALGPLPRADMGEEVVTTVVYGPPGSALTLSEGYLCGVDLTGDGGGDILVDSNGGDAVWVIDDPQWGAYQLASDVAEETAAKHWDGAMDAVGDVTGDGHEDVVITFDMFDGPFTAASAPFAEFAWNGSSGTDALDLGDADQDGTDDLLIAVSDYLDVGAVFLLYGPVVAGTYQPEDADLRLTVPGGGDGAALGAELFGSAAGQWGATAPGLDGEYTTEGGVFLMSGTFATAL